MMIGCNAFIGCGYGYHGHIGGCSIGCFAVVGAGGLGNLVIEELLNAKARKAGKIERVVILTRPESAGKESIVAFADKGAVVAPTDYSDKAALVASLAGVDVIISTLTHYALDQQVPIAEVAKEAGVKLFVPSEFGMATDTATDGLLGLKANIARKIRDLGLPTTLFFTGGFSDALWEPFLNLDLKSGKVKAGGDGEKKMTFTSRLDIARFVAHAVIALPSPDLQNKTFRIEGSRASLNEVFKAYEDKHGQKLEVEYTPVDELRAAIEANPHDIPSILHLAWATGAGQIGETVDNDKFSGWNPKPVFDFV